MNSYNMLRGLIKVHSRILIVVSHLEHSLNRDNRDWGIWCNELRYYSCLRSYRMATILFDPDSTYSYLSINFALDFDVICDVLDSTVHISTAIRESVMFTDVYYAYSYFIYKILHLDCLGDFEHDEILGITWVSFYHVVLNYNAKTITLEILDRERLECEGCTSLSQLK